MPCAESANPTCGCCCKHCEHDKLSGCVECCPCVPRYLCISWFPDNLSLTVGNNRVQHQGDGVYEAGLGDIVVTITKNDDGDCVWHIVSEDWEIDTEVLRSVAGCLIEADTLITIDDAVNPLSSNVGTIVIEVYGRIIVPLETSTGNCKERVCGNCVCFPRCLCIRQQIEYEYEGGSYRDETASRAIKACWDSELGELGGWHAQFPVEAANNCWPAYDVLITLEADDDGDCQFHINVNDGEFYGVSDTDLSCPNPHTVSGSWEFDSEDGWPIADPIDPMLRAALTFGAVAADCGDSNCPTTCCPDAPNTLTATVQGYSSDDGPCADEFEVTLTRFQCSGEWRGTVEFAWECDDDGPGMQNAAIAVQPCGGAIFNYYLGRCVCNACTGDEDPAVNGCGTINLKLTHPTDGNMAGGAGANQNAKCGNVTSYGGGTNVQSTFDPIYQEYFIPVAGFAGCCDNWHIIITE